MLILQIINGHMLKRRVFLNDFMHQNLDPGQTWPAHAEHAHSVGAVCVHECADRQGRLVSKVTTLI